MSKKISPLVVLYLILYNKISNTKLKDLSTLYLKNESQHQMSVNAKRKYIQITSGDKRGFALPAEHFEYCRLVNDTL